MTFEEFKHQVTGKGLNSEFIDSPFPISAGKKKLDIFIGADPAKIQDQALLIPLDYIYTMPSKMLAILASKLGINKTIFARNCEVQKIDKQTAAKFLNAYHFMNTTQSAFNFGLYYKEELLAVASFSKGRKMNRLPRGKLSFELIRFCCKEGITIIGGLSKLMKHFSLEKNAGDIMTYVNKEFSDGSSFLKAGFKIIGETPPITFLVNKKTFERSLFTGQDFDKKLFYKIQNSGNLKMTFTLNNASH